MKKEEKLIRFLEYRGISTVYPLGHVKAKEMEKAVDIVEDYNKVVENVNRIFGYKESEITVSDVLDYWISVSKPVKEFKPVEPDEWFKQAGNIEDILKIHPFFVSYVLDKKYQPMVKMFNTEKVLRLLEDKKGWAEQTEHLISRFAEFKSVVEDRQPGTLENMYHMLILQPVNNQKFSKKLLKLGEFNLIRAVQLLDIKLTPEKNELIKYIINEVNELKSLRAYKNPLSVEDYVNILNTGNIAGNDFLDKLIMNNNPREELSEYLVLKDMDVLIANEAMRVAEYYEIQPELKEV